MSPARKAEEAIAPLMRVKSWTLATSILLLLSLLYVIDSMAAESQIPPSTVGVGGVKLSGVYSRGTSEDDAAFAPFLSVPSERAPSDQLPAVLQFSQGTQNLQIAYERYAAALSFPDESQRLSSSALIADVWVVASVCRPDVVITWIDLWGELQGGAYPTEQHRAWTLELAVPGAVQEDAAAGVFGSAVGSQGAEKFDGWSWSGWYVRPADAVQSDVSLNVDTDLLACADTDVEERGRLSEQVWSRIAAEAESSQLTIELESAVDDGEGRISFGSVAVVSGRLADAEMAMAWAQRLADWTHGNMETRAQLHIAPLDGAPAVEIGETLEYGYQLANVGVAPARHVELQLPMPRELRYVADSGATSHGAVFWDEDASFLTWHLGPTLLPGEVATLTFQVIVH